jgi:hypothetical protein
MKKMAPRLGGLGKGGRRWSYENSKYHNSNKIIIIIFDSRYYCLNIKKLFRW